MRDTKKVAMGLLIVLAALLSGPAAEGPNARVNAQGAQLWVINFISSCDYRCPFYDPGSGCWCIKLPPIVVQG